MLSQWFCILRGAMGERDEGEMRERQELRSLMFWFRKRYRSNGERLTYARRAYSRWRSEDLGEPRGGAGEDGRGGVEILGGALEGAGGGELGRR